jgi:hypothetical protein
MAGDLGRRRGVSYLFPEVVLPEGFVPPSAALMTVPERVAATAGACAGCGLDDLPPSPTWRLCRYCLELRELRRPADMVERYADPNPICDLPSLFGRAALITFAASGLALLAAVPVIAGIELGFPLPARVLADLLGPPFIAACGCIGWRLRRRGDRTSNRTARFVGTTAAGSHERWT